MNSVFRCFMSFVVLCSFFMISSTTFADSIGTINMDRIFESYKEARKAEDTFAKQKEAYEKKFKKHEEKISKAREKKKKEKDIQALIEKMETELAPLQENLLKLRAQLTYQLRQKVTVVAKKVAKEQGLDVVVDNKAVLLGGYDITEFVIDQLNAIDTAK